MKVLLNLTNLVKGGVLQVAVSFLANALRDRDTVWVVALSGGYTRDEANERLARQNGMVASFSRALSEGLSAQQDDAAFNAMLDSSIESIFQASST